MLILDYKNIVSFLVLIAFCIKCDSFFLGQYSPTIVNRQKNNISSLSRRGKTIILDDNNKHYEATTTSGLTIAIVGAGVGGLSIASRIASSSNLPPSTKVVIIEKNSREMVGGRCGSFTKNVPGIGEFRFERGPSLLLLKDVYLDLFKDCKKDAKNDYGVDIDQCVPAYQVVFDDGDTIQLGFPSRVNNSNLKDNIDSLRNASRYKMNQYEQNGAGKWDEYMRATEAFLDCGLPNFIEEVFDLKSFPSFIVEATRSGFKSWPLKPHSDVLDNIFSSNKMKALASFQDLYVGLEPYKNNDQFGGGVLKKTAPAVFGLLAALELHPSNNKAGVFAPIGGFDKISRAFEQLAIDSGVEMIYNTNVQSVSSKGIYYNNVGNNTDEPEQFLPADIVIVNADLPYSKKILMNGSEKKRDTPVTRYDWDDKYDFSSGVIAFYWSIKKRCDSLNTHNVFLVSSSRTNMEKSWSAVRFNDPEKSCFGDLSCEFNFYVHRACGVDESAAPKDCESVMVLVPCCTLKRDKKLVDLPKDLCIDGYKQQFDDNFIARVKEKVLHRLGALNDLEDLESYIVDETIETPATYADKYNLAAGTPFALSHGFEQLSLTRPGQQSRESDNILFVGASTRPGNGVPLVLLGSKQVAKKAISMLQTKITS